MVRATTPKPGDWVGLAMYRKVPGVNRSTPREEAIERLIDQLFEDLLAQHGPPPSMTEYEYRAFCRTG